MTCIVDKTRRDLINALQLHWQILQRDNFDNLSDNAKLQLFWDVKNEVESFVDDAEEVLA